MPRLFFSLPSPNRTAAVGASSVNVCKIRHYRPANGDANDYGNGNANGVGHEKPRVLQTSSVRTILSPAERTVHDADPIEQGSPLRPR
jgi:hypothetical protein